jgi:hypothetical protein
MSATHQPKGTWPDQLSFPGQTHVARGSHDLGDMYRAHYAFRRDLAGFEAAVRHTPVGEADTWEALEQRWELFAFILHHHHTIEDVTIWPVLLGRADAAGDSAAVEVLHAMEAEHDLIDPTLAACTEGFAAMTARPGEDQRNALDVHVTTARQLLLDHLRHEETAALPLVQRTMTGEEWRAAQEYAERGVPIGRLVALVPWVMHGLAPEVRAREVRSAPLPVRVLLRLFGRRFERREVRAFRYA